MRVTPDADEAQKERESAGRILSAVLERVHAQVCADGIVGDVPARALTYPGLFAAAYAAQAACRDGSPQSAEYGVLAAGLRDAVRRADESDARRRVSGCAIWAVDLAPPEQHLRQSLARAVSQVPQRPERLEALAALRIGTWSQPERAMFGDAVSLLAEAWPQMLDELRIVVVQLALLDGFGIDGFTDVATHGAIYVNRARLCDDAKTGLPGAVRLAEAMVHEGAHNRCNAAALSTPFLVDAKSGDEPVVETPLRPDPRPLTGLLQQLVVLVRSHLLYERLLDREPPRQPALIARSDKLRGQGLQALRVISAHTVRLTAHGRDVVEHATELLAGTAAPTTR
jgi:HEXXH motif-containing protein